MKPETKLLAIIAVHILDLQCTKKGTLCKICSIIYCPSGSPYHNAKSGCPVCAPRLSFMCIECNRVEVEIAEGIDTCSHCRSKGA